MYLGLEVLMNNSSYNPLERPIGYMKFKEVLPKMGNSKKYSWREPAFFHTLVILSPFIKKNNLGECVLLPL